MGEPQLSRQQRPKGIVATLAGMEGVEEELRLTVETRGDRRVAGRRPVAGRFQEWLALLSIRAEDVVRDRDSDAICGGSEIVASIE
jgi:hypothetical protein